MAAHPAGLVFGARDPSPEPAGLPELGIGSRRELRTALALLSQDSKAA